MTSLCELWNNLLTRGDERAAFYCSSRKYTASGGQRANQQRDLLNWFALAQTKESSQPMQRLCLSRAAWSKSLRAGHGKQSYKNIRKVCFWTQLTGWRGVQVELLFLRLKHVCGSPSVCTSCEGCTKLHYKINKLGNGCLTNQWSSTVVLNLLTSRPIVFEGP